MGPSADGPAPSDKSGSGTGDARFERLGRRKVREAWEVLRGQMCGAIRLGMRRLIVAHSDEQGSPA